MISKRILFFLLTILIFIACKKEDSDITSNEPLLLEEVVTTSNEVNPELKPYINAFREEGKKRGMTFTARFEALIVDDFSDPSYRNTNVAGLGWWNYRGEGARVEIKEATWKSITNLEKENLVYHELGHAFLNRDHLNFRLADGANPKSIMCSEACRQVFTIFYSDGPLREYYLNELFDQGTPAPNFLEKNQLFKTVFTDNFQTGIANWQTQNLTSDMDTLDYQVNLDTTFSEFDNKYVIIEKKETSDRNTIMVFYQNVDFSFEEDKNIIAEANVSIEGFGDGWIEFNLKVVGKNEENEYETFFSYSDRITRDFIKSDVDKKFRVKGFCIPQESEYFVVSFYVNSKNKGRVTLKDVKVDLFK